MMRWNPASVKSLSADDAAGWRSRLFGDMIDQRLAIRPQHLTAQHVEVLRRRRQVADLMLSSTHMFKKRSRRALECSGPCPSKP